MNVEFQIHDNDVKCGRGHGSNRHEGNIFYRKIVQERKEEYRNQTTNFGKTLIAKDIVHIIHNRNPPGRFIEQDGKTNRWTIVPDEEAEKKVKQALREKESMKDIQMREASKTVVTTQPLIPMPPLEHQPRRISLNSSQASMQISRRISLSSSQTSTMMASLHSSGPFDASTNNTRQIDPCPKQPAVQDHTYSRSGQQCVAPSSTSHAFNHGTIYPDSCSRIGQKVENDQCRFMEGTNLHTLSETVKTQHDNEGKISPFDKNDMLLSHYREDQAWHTVTTHPKNPKIPKMIHSSKDFLNDRLIDSANKKTNIGKLSIGSKSSQDPSSLDMSSSDLKKLLSDCSGDNLKEQAQSKTSAPFHIIGYDDIKLKQGQRYETEEQRPNQHISSANPFILKKPKKRFKPNFFNRKCHPEQQDVTSDMSVASDTSLTLADLDSSSVAKASGSNENSGRLIDNIMIVDTTNTQLACSDSSLSLGDVFQTFPNDSTTNLPRVDEKLECLDESGDLSKYMMDNSTSFVHDKKSCEGRKQSSNIDEFWCSEISKMEASFQSSLKILGDVESLC